MSAPADIVSIDLGADTYEGWDSYDVAGDMLTPADSFSVSGWFGGAATERRELLRRINESGGRLYLYVQRQREDGSPGPRARQMVGLIDKVDVEGDRDDGAQITISGTDNGGLLTRASADPRLGVTDETTLVEMVVAVCEPFGLSVVTEAAPGRTLMTGARSARSRDQLVIDHARAYGVPAREMRRSFIHRRSLERETRSVPLDEASGAGSATRAAERARRGHASGQTGSDVERLRLPEAKPAIGETVWDFVDRHCRRFGVMPWIDAEGRLVISSPNYDQEPLYTLRRYLDPSAAGGNNILRGGSHRDYGALSSECTVYGRSHGADATRSPFRAREENPNQSFYRPLVLHDPTARSEEDARRRARRELARQNEAAFFLEYEVHSHGQGSLIWAQDTTVDVVDEEVGVEGIYYVVSRQLRCDRKHGAYTKLRLVPLGAIVL